MSVVHVVHDSNDAQDSFVPQTLVTVIASANLYFAVIHIVLFPSHDKTAILEGLKPRPHVEASVDAHV